MSSRIEEKFANCAKENKKALINFVMGGDPDLTKSAHIIGELAKSGTDIIEIGMPFSDPMADGATIEAAGLRSLASGTKLRNIIEIVSNFRKNDNETPIILMGYYNPIYSYGVENFCKDAEKAGVDGVILVDLPPEEELEFVEVAVKYDIKLIRLITPTTDDARLAKLVKNASGFLYYISVAGVTGAKSADIDELETRVNHLKSKTNLPIAVGFGVKTPEQAAQIAKFSDAVVIGSALVDIINKKSENEALEFVKRLKKAI